MAVNEDKGFYRGEQRADPSSGIVRLVQAADEPVSTAALYSSTSLTAALAANKTYRFEFILCWRSSNTDNGVAFSIDGPASPVFILYHVQTPTSGAANFDRWETAYNALNPSNAVDAANADRLAFVTGIIRTGSNITAPLQLRLASETDVTRTVTLMAGSTGVITQLD